MPDLGKYAAEVGIAYGASLFLLFALVGFVWMRARRVRRALEELEEGRKFDV